MNAWILLAGLTLIALVYVVLPVASAAFAHYRRPRAMRCPAAGRTAVVTVDPIDAARAAVIGLPPQAVQTCSLWPARAGCRRDCLEGPEEPMPELETATLGTPAHFSIRRMLVPLDGTAASEAALGLVAGLARARGAHVRLMRVAAVPGEVRTADDRIVAYADQELARVEMDLGAYLRSVAAGYPDLDIDTVVAFGDPADEILREAGDADLVAMVRHRRVAPGRWFRRSVTAAVTRAGLLPVIVVPERRATPVPAGAAPLTGAR